MMFEVVSGMSMHESATFFRGLLGFTVLIFGAICTTHLWRATAQGSYASVGDPIIMLGRIFALILTVLVLIVYSY